MIIFKGGLFHGYMKPFSVVTLNELSLDYLCLRCCRQIVQSNFFFHSKSTSLIYAYKGFECVFCFYKNQKQKVVSAFTRLQLVATSASSRRGRSSSSLCCKRPIASVKWDMLAPGGVTVLIRNWLKKKKKNAIIWNRRSTWLELLLEKTSGVTYLSFGFSTFRAFRRRVHSFMTWQPWLRITIRCSVALRAGHVRKNEVSE